MKKGFHFNYTLKVVLPGKRVSMNFQNYERACQEYFYYKNQTDALIGVLWLNSLGTVLKAFQ